MGGGPGRGALHIYIYIYINPFFAELVACFKKRLSMAVQHPSEVLERKKARANAPAMWGNAVLAGNVGHVMDRMQQCVWTFIYIYIWNIRR